MQVGWIESRKRGRKKDCTGNREGETERERLFIFQSRIHYFLLKVTRYFTHRNSIKRLISESHNIITN